MGDAAADPVLIVNQEMVVRLGAVTGVGHARLIIERFGKFWGAFSVGDLFILNFLTIVTEFIGVSLSLGYFGVSQYVSPGRGGGAGLDHDLRQLPILGAGGVRVRELPRDPAAGDGPSERRGYRPAPRHPRHLRRRELDVGPADHRDGRNHVFGTKSSLHRTFKDAKLFYSIFAALIAGAAAIVLIPGAPLGVITLAVQALAGVLLPSATVFLVLLCNDGEILGPWCNPGWLNVIASTIVATLILLSLIGGG